MQFLIHLLRPTYFFLKSFHLTFILTLYVYTYLYLFPPASLKFSDSDHFLIVGFYLLVSHVLDSIPDSFSGNPCITFTLTSHCLSFLHPSPSHTDNTRRMRSAFPLTQGRKDSCSTVRTLLCWQL